MKLSYLIFLGFFLILVLFSITTYINFRQSEKVNENSEWFARSATIVRNSHRFQRNILNMVSGFRGFLFTGEDQFIQAYDSAALENNNILKELSQLIEPNTSQEKDLKEILSLNDRWINDFARPLIDARKQADASDSSQAAFRKLYKEKMLTGDDQNINRALQAKFRSFSNYEYDLREKQKNTLTHSDAQTRAVSFSLTTFSIVIGLAIAFFLAGLISSRIMRMVKMADTIAAGNYEVSTDEKGSTELSRLARSLNRMARVLSENIKLLKRKNAELDQFAHVVSHDLKAPLRGIDNVVTWIEEDHDKELSPKVKEYIQLIKGRLIRAENLIKGILSYARVGREMPERELVDLNAMMLDIRDNLPLRAGLSLHVQAGLPKVFTARIPLQQILSNLLGNAIKYHDKPNGNISVGFREAETHYVFRVEDDGPGIAKIYHDKIFGIFQTLQERDSFESTGLGLAIVKKILEDRKQSISVDSDSGRGAVFSFTWPK
jgi:signal transduction histidine kinase